MWMIRVGPNSSTNRNTSSMLPPGLCRARKINHDDAQEPRCGIGDGNELTYLNIAGADSIARTAQGATTTADLIFLNPAPHLAIYFIGT